MSDPTTHKQYAAPTPIVYAIVEEVPNYDGMRFFVTTRGGEDPRVEKYKEFATVPLARAYFRSIGIPDHQVSVEYYEP